MTTRRWLLYFRTPSLAKLLENKHNLGCCCWESQSTGFQLSTFVPVCYSFGIDLWRIDNDSMGDIRHWRIVAAFLFYLFLRTNKTWMCVLRPSVIGFFFRDSEFFSSPQPGSQVFARRNSRPLLLPFAEQICLLSIVPIFCCFSFCETNDRNIILSTCVHIRLGGIRSHSYCLSISCYSDC